MFKKILIPKPIIPLIVLCIILTILRVVLFDKYSLIFLLWNILLAIIPFFISSIILYFHKNKKLKKWIFIILGIVWLLFLPNAPYIVTDLIHIGVVRAVPVIYDAILLFISALIGLLFGMYSVSQIEEVLLSKYSKKTTSILIFLSILLASFGMYLGRFLRFNSWDLLTNPLNSSIKFFTTLSSSSYHLESLVYVLLFFSFICISYYSWKLFREK